MKALISKLRAGFVLLLIIVAGATVQAQPLKVAYIYAITPDGTLQWRRYDGNETGHGTLSDPVDVDAGWGDFKHVFPGGNSIIYAITQDGMLKWFKHTGFEDGLVSPDGWEMNDMGGGWGDYDRVFSAGDGIIYAMSPNGKLYWYRHNGYLDGRNMDSPGAWQGPKEVGSEWNQFTLIFAGGRGTVYGVSSEDNRLKWYRHVSHGIGIKQWEERKDVGGPGWGTYKHIFASSDGVIYAVTEDGRLLWYKEADYLHGAKAWDGPYELGDDWSGYLHVFALMPNTGTTIPGRTN